MATLTLLAPITRGTFATRGATYTSDANGYISINSALTNDVLDLITDGCILVSTSSRVGTPGTGVTAVEYGNGWDHTTVLTLGAGCVLPAIAGGAALGVGSLIYTLPAGAQIVSGAQINVGITQTTGNINANTPTVGLGTVVASGVVSVLSGTATFQNINVGVATANCTGTPVVQTAKATASPFELVIEAAGAKSIYFNAAATWAASGDPAALLRGTVTLNWRSLA